MVQHHDVPSGRTGSDSRISIRFPIVTPNGTSSQSPQSRPLSSIAFPLPAPAVGGAGGAPAALSKALILFNRFAILSNLRCTPLPPLPPLPNFPPRPAPFPPFPAAGFRILLLLTQSGGKKDLSSVGLANLQVGFLLSFISSLYSF